MKLFNLSGRTALVTGSNKGIGYALAQALGAAGARIVRNARDATKLREAMAALRAEGVVAEAAAFDVTDAAAVDAGITRIEQDIGVIDILVNNAGMQHRGAFAEFPTDAQGLLAVGRWLRQNENAPDGAFAFWRSRRDSNPRCRFCPHTPLAGEHLRPLGHDSKVHRF